MPTRLRASMLTVVLMAWSAVALAQTSPGAPATDGALPPAGAADEGMDWLWIIALIAVVAVVLFYFLGRGRGSRL